ncbi:MAG: sigma 54-interacting transcriptional regulator [Deltaproteobacteria bacterium]|nr:sigma 54-interacting transcriptional regulator [Deltaproteobacteria bacterium]
MPRATASPRRRAGGSRAARLRQQTPFLWAHGLLRGVPQETRFTAWLVPGQGRRPAEWDWRTQAEETNGGSRSNVRMECPVKGAHPVVRVIVAAAERLARDQVAVFVIGERGCGKELLARHLHDCGRPAGAPFVRIDCAEASFGRLEDGLFGRAGGLERAVGGTLFLDDLGALPLELQDRLLAGLEGAAAPPRIVAACASEAEQEERLGRLSAALRRFLDPVELVVPALRQRRADIPLLVEHFLATYAAQHGTPPVRIDNEALVQLWRYDWPGNVRELASVIERVVVLCRSGVVRTADLPPQIFSAACAAAAPPPPSSAPSAGPGLRPLS